MTDTTLTNAEPTKAPTEIKPKEPPKHGLIKEDQFPNKSGYTYNKGIAFLVADILNRNGFRAKVEKHKDYKHKKSIYVVATTAPQSDPIWQVVDNYVRGVQNALKEQHKGA